MGDASSFPDTDRANVLAAELRTTFGKLKRKLREYGGRSDLTPSQVAVMHRLEKDGPSAVSTLARAEGMRPQSMSAIVSQLIKAGFLVGSSDPNDGRQTLMSLSRKSLDLLKEGRAARQDWLTAKIQEKLSLQEQNKIAEALQALLRLVED